MYHGLENQDGRSHLFPLPIAADDGDTPTSLGTPGPWSPGGLVATSESANQVNTGWSGYIIAVDGDGVIYRLNTDSEDIDEIYDLGADVESTPAILGAYSINDILIGDNDGKFWWISSDGESQDYENVGDPIKTPITLDRYQSDVVSNSPYLALFGAAGKFYCYEVDPLATGDKITQEWYYNAGGTVTGGAVILNVNDGASVAFSSSNGTVYCVWIKTEHGHTKGDYRWSNSDPYLPCMPCVGGGKVFVISGSEQKLYAINPSTGSTTWSATLEDEDDPVTFPTQTIAAVYDEGTTHQVFAPLGTHVYVRSISDGSAIRELAASGGSSIYGPPVVDSSDNVWFLDSTGVLKGYSGSTNIYSRDLGTFGLTGMVVFPATATTATSARLAVRNSSGQVLRVGD